MNSIQTLAYSRVTRPQHKWLKAYLCWGKRLKRLCVVWTKESLQEWTQYPLSCLRLEARQQQQSWQRHARKPGRWRNGWRSGQNHSSYLYQKKATSGKIRTIIPISLISHPSKIILWVILNWLKAKAEELPAEEQTGFRPGRSTVEQIFNSRVITKKHLQCQRNLFHNFMDFRKVLDRFWHACLWHVLRSFNTVEGLVQAIQARYESSSSAVLWNGELG